MRALQFLPGLSWSIAKDLLSGFESAEGGCSGVTFWEMDRRRAPHVTEKAAGQAELETQGCPLGPEVPSVVLELAAPGGTEAVRSRMGGLA